MIPIARLRATWWRRLRALWRVFRIRPTCSVCFRFGMDRQEHKAIREFFHQAHLNVDRWSASVERLAADSYASCRMIRIDRDRMTIVRVLGCPQCTDGLCDPRPPDAGKR